MKKYLSYGAGVGSTGLICYMLDEIQAGDIEIVFSDHGGDWPETYEYVDYIQQKLDIKITTLKVNIEGKGNLYDYFYHYKTVPLYQYRICTDRGKITPFNKYIKRPCKNYLGITWDERKRGRLNKLKTVTNYYPLIEDKITRDDVIELIKDYGLKVPMKSGCYFCPFQRKSQWHKLYKEHNDLFIKAIELEENGNGILINPNGISLRTFEKRFQLEENTIKNFEEWL